MAHQLSITLDLAFQLVAVDQTTFSVIWFTIIQCSSQKS